MTTPPAPATTQRAPQVFGYHVLWPSDPADRADELTREAEDAFREMRGRGWFAGLEWSGCLSDDVREWETPLLDRPGGAQLDSQLVAGDVVILARHRSARDALDLATVIDEWRRKGVRSYFTLIGPILDSAPEKSEHDVARAIQLMALLWPAGVRFEAGKE